jgi:type IV secretion system protein VirB5
MPAPHKKPFYKPIDLSNPFQEGQDRAYADILLDKMKETRFWRRSVFLNALLFAVSLILFFYAVSLQKTVPLLVNVMPSGESHYLGEVRQNGPFQVPDAAVLFQIRSFISCLRSVPTDFQVLQNNMEDCFSMVTSAYSPVLRQFIISNSPYELVGKLRRSVDIESVLNITERSYQINWSETVVEPPSSSKISKMRAVVTICLLTPTDATIKKNPLGIYIENFEMTSL